jgi:hypothetical protein
MNLSITHRVFPAPAKVFRVPFDFWVGFYGGIAFLLNANFLFSSGPLLLPDSNYRYLPIGAELFHVWVGSVFDTPGYPLFIWIVFQLFGKNFSLFLVQGILSALTLSMAYTLAKQWKLGKWSHAVPLILLLNPVTPLLANTALSECFFGFLLTLTLYLMIIPSQRPMRRGGLLGLSIAAVTLTRANGLLILLLLGSGFLLRALVLKRWREFAAMATCATLPVLGWVGINASLQGVWGISQGSGWQLMSNLSYMNILNREFLPEEVRDRYSDYISLGPIREYYMYTRPPGLDVSKMDALFGKIARASVKSDPVAYLKAIPRAFCHPAAELRGLTRQVQSPQTWSAFRDEGAKAGFACLYVGAGVPAATYTLTLPFYSKLKYSILSLLLVPALLLLLRRGNLEQILVCLIPLANSSALALLLNPIDRYHAPFEPMMLLAFFSGIRLLIPERIAEKMPSLPPPQTEPASAALARPKRLIIIPAFNEAPALATLIAQCRKQEGWDLLVIDDGSTDETRRVVQELDVPLIPLLLNLGIGGAVQTGYRYALLHGYDWAVQVDGDGQHDPGEIGKLWQHAQQADLIIGSRFIHKGGFQSSCLRRLGIRCISLTIQLLSGVKIFDVTSGMRLANRKVIQKFCQYYPVDYPEPETIAMLIRAKVRLLEVPITMKERQSGASSIRGLHSFLYMIKVLPKVVVSLLLSRYS